MSTATVHLQTSPHLRTARSVPDIMRIVALSLLPVCAWSVYAFGISAAALILVTTATCLLAEQVCCRWSGKASTLGDWSAVITGLLLALTLPPGFPLWMAVIAGVFGIAVGKMLFGGLGYNVMNPALLGRAFVQASFTVPITTWTPALAPGRFSEFIPSTLTFPFAQPVDIKAWLAGLHLDGFTGATPLALAKAGEAVTSTLSALFLGFCTGSAGETSALLILLGGLYLAVRKMLDWRIVAATLGSAALLSGVLHLVNPAAYSGPLFTLFTGGLMLGAVYMATDMVASPVTPAGVWVYGVMIGVLTVVIRFFGGLSEGVMYAILLANLASPLISRLTQPRRYGAPRRERKAKA